MIFRREDDEAMFKIEVFRQDFLGGGPARRFLTVVVHHTLTADAGFVSQFR